MTRKEIAKLIYKYLNSKSFFGSMYGGKVAPDNPALEIKTEDCSFNTDRGIQYIWGWPGPDYNVYRWEDYGKSWAFTKEELVE